GGRGWGWLGGVAALSTDRSLEKLCCPNLLQWTHQNAAADGRLRGRRSRLRITVGDSRHAGDRGRDQLASAVRASSADRLGRAGLRDTKRVALGHTRFTRP